MASLLRRTRAVLAVYYASMAEYRAELLLWALSNSLSFILMGAWYQATYFLAVFVIRQLTVVWVIWEVEQDMQKGRFAHFLLAPLDPVWRYIALHVAERIARLPFSVGLVVLFFLLYRDAVFVPDPIGLVEGLAFALVAFALRFLIQYTFALLSFWTERASSVESLVFIVYMFLSGAVAPLDFFPPAIKDAVMLTPFPYLIWVPARLIVGGGHIDVARAALVCGAWTLGLLVLNRVVWARGLKRFSAQGA
jgi:ABC-2 type transport system permease protein